jgi:hypothetical protein
MRYLLALFLLCNTAYAQGNYSLFNVEKLEIKHAKMSPGNRDPYVPWYTGSWYTKSELEWRVSMLGPIYWDNNMHMEMINSTTVKTVGWQYELGVRILDSVSVYWGHHSRHVLDEPAPELYISGNQFPVEDSIGIRIKIMEEKVGRGLFK